MDRNLVICCDGTANQFGKHYTNVVRLVQVLCHDPAKQLLYYDPGVGTLPEPGRLFRRHQGLSDVLGLAFGIGLEQNVQEAYVYLMNSWAPGDRVFLFGFSRGAYTVRVLAGLLHATGLLPRGSENLVPYLMQLFSAVRREKHAEGKSTYWRLCNLFRWTFARPTADAVRNREAEEERRFPVHFVGLWDTVSSVGWVWDPVTFPYTSRNPSVHTIRHAVSLDERRAFYRQNLFQCCDAVQQDLREQWFPGAHGDIGGDYPEEESGLWRMPFEWIVREAQQAGLLVHPQRLQQVLSRTPPPSRPWAEPRHESLTLGWWPAEFFPKLRRRGSSSWRWPRMGLGRRRSVRPETVLHESVLRRIRETAYTPSNLPRELVAAIRSLPADSPWFAGNRLSIQEFLQKVQTLDAAEWGAGGVAPPRELAEAG